MHSELKIRTPVFHATVLEWVRKLNLSVRSAVQIRQIIQVLSIAHRHRCQEQMTKILRVRIMQLALP